MSRTSLFNTVRILILALLLMGVTPAAVAAVAFQLLPSLQGDAGNSVRGVSADGSVAVGESHSATGSSAVYWRNGVAWAIGSLDAGVTDSVALAASANGSVIVGYASTRVGDSLTSRTFRWTAATGTLGLGDGPGAALGNQAMGVSADGSVIVGQRQPANPAEPSESEAFAWTPAGGMVGLPSLMPEFHRHNNAAGVSADGTVIVGTCGYGGPFRWTQAGGIVPLYGLTDTGLDRAVAVSADGTIIVGAGGGEAFIWKQATGVQWLGVPSGKEWSWANDVSSDGGIVVGAAEHEGEPTDAIVWTPGGGLRFLRDAMSADFGLDIPAGALAEATGVSADGTVIVGNGAAGAWMITLPEPAALVPPVAAMVLLFRRNRL